MSVMKIETLLFLCLSIFNTLYAGESKGVNGWKKQTLTSEFYAEGSAMADINQDGLMDLVAGPFWYAGPDFKTKHSYYEPTKQGK